MARYGLNMEVRGKKCGSEHAWVAAPALIDWNCVLRFSSLVFVSNPHPPHVEVG